jgi:hypothetical protein
MDQENRILSEQLDKGLVLEGHDVQRKERYQAGRYFWWYVVDGQEMPVFSRYERVEHLRVSG